MSGGYFDYDCFRISRFADDLKHEIEKNNIKNDYGDATDFNQKTIALLSTSQQVIEVAAELAKEIEWLYSSDIGEADFGEAVSSILSGKVEI